MSNKPQWVKDAEKMFEEKDISEFCQIHNQFDSDPVTTEEVKYLGVKWKDGTPVKHFKIERKNKCTT